MQRRQHNPHILSMKLHSTNWFILSVRSCTTLLLYVKYKFLLTPHQCIHPRQKKEFHSGPSAAEAHQPTASVGSISEPRVLSWVTPNTRPPPPTPQQSHALHPFLLTPHQCIHPRQDTASGYTNTLIYYSAMQENGLRNEVRRIQR